MNIRAFLTLAVVLFTAAANAQFQIPNLPAKLAGYIVIGIKPDASRLFIALDVDGDGNLSWAEIEKAPLALGRLDLNRNGRLDPSETGSNKETEVQGQRSGFVVEYGLTRTECHDLKQELGIPKIITLRVTQEDAWYTDIEKGWLLNRAKVQLVGATADLAEVLNFQLERGRFLKQRDDVHTMSVAVIGQDVARKLFPGDNPIGKHLKIADQYFHVVGVLKKRHPRPLAVYIPTATMRGRFGDTEFKRKSGGITARKYEITKAWIPVKDTSQAHFLLREITRRLDPKKTREDLKIKYVPTK